MSEPATLRLTADEFLDWAQHQEGRYELVDGIPQMMAGAKAQHDPIALNVLVALRAKLRGGPCRPFTADYAVRIPTGQVRRPGVGVECAPIVPDQLAAEQPRHVAEVLSPSTRSFDLVRKLDECKGVPGLAHILLPAPDMAQATLWSHAGDAWQRSDHGGLDAEIPLPGLGVTLTMTEVCEDVPFPPRPRPVLDR